MRLLRSLFLLLPVLLTTACTSEDYSELMAAAHLGDVDGMQRIMERGANVNEQSRNGKTALLLASSRGHLKAVYLLIGRGAEVNMGDAAGTTPLISAATNGHDKVVELLLKNGAQAEVRDANGNSAFRNAVFFRHDEVVSAMLRFRDTIPADELAEGLLTAAALGYTDVLQLMIKAGVNVNQPGVQNRTAAMAAVEFNQIEALKFLLANGADLTLTDLDNNTALDLARDKGNESILALLENNKKKTP